MDRWDTTLRSLWTDLGGPGSPDVVWSGPDGLLPSAFGVQDLAVASVAAAACAGRELGAARGSTAAVPAVDARRVAAAFRGDQLLRLDGERSPSFAPLSGFWRTADGWVRTHANYPHHRDRLLAALDLPATADRDSVAAAMSGRRAADVETAVVDAGGIAVAVRAGDEWDAHPQGRAVAAAPLMERAATAGGAGPAFGPVDLPASGVRVLDLTRVLAGPVATRTLALLGADVLRVDPPGMAEPPAQHLDTGPGKRSTLLDLRTATDRATLEELLSDSHVVVTAYRPGALAAFGLDPDTLAERRPDLVVAALSAWGGGGPFAGRRGFDSIVQAACGIAVRSAAPDGTPGALPAQALDHATGYLTAAGVLLGLADRVRHGTGTVLRPALARTAHRLRTLPASDHPAVDDPLAEAASELVDLDAPDGRLRIPRPAFGPPTWPHPPHPWGSDPVAWA